MKSLRSLRYLGNILHRAQDWSWHLGKQRKAEVILRRKHNLEIDKHPPNHRDVDFTKQTREPWHTKTRAATQIKRQTVWRWMFLDQPLRVTSLLIPCPLHVGITIQCTQYRCLYKKKNVLCSWKCFTNSYLTLTVNIPFCTWMTDIHGSTQATLHMWRSEGIPGVCAHLLPYFEAESLDCSDM